MTAGGIFHPNAIGKARAHERRVRGTCGIDAATSKKERRELACTCVVDPADLADIWAGRARMAAARRVVGAPLDRIDIEAIEREIAGLW
jgi:hypothetical protein